MLLDYMSFCLLALYTLALGWLCFQPRVINLHYHHHHYFPGYAKEDDTEEKAEDKESDAEEKSKDKEPVAEL
jgi:uncharacterized membrane protein